MSDKPAVVKHSVTIHTIKVGKKQFTASMFKQLPNLDSIFADETKSELVGEIWGYVNLADGIYYIVEVLGSLRRVKKDDNWDIVTSVEAVPHTQEALISMAQGDLGRGKTRAERDEAVVKMQVGNAAAAEKFQKVTDKLVAKNVLPKPQLFI